MRATVFGTRFVFIALQKQYYSKENLERLWRYYCEKYPDKKDKLDLRVYVERAGTDSKSEKERGFDANFNRQGEGALARGGDNEFYSYRPDIDKPDQTENVQLKGKYPFLRDAYSGDPVFDFLLAASKGDLAGLRQYLATGGDVNARDNKGRTALMSACSADRMDIVEFLLAKGASPNLKDQDGDTALAVAAMGDMSEAGKSRRGNLGIVRMLLAGGADPNAKGGWPPLVVAAEHGDNDLIRFLLENGADINAKNERGMTALSRAIYDGNIDTAKLLLAKGADLESRDSSDDTPLIHAASQNRDIVRELLDRGAKPNVRNENLETPLMLAYSVANVLALLEHGAELEAKDQKGLTALMHAVLHRNTKGVRVLLEKGADVNARTPGGETALSIARHSNIQPCIELLLKFGATEQKR
jgi:ankyrin repeat protein